MSRNRKAFPSVEASLDEIKETLTAFHAEALTLRDRFALALVNSAALFQVDSLDDDASHLIVERVWAMADLLVELRIPKTPEET